MSSLGPREVRDRRLEINGPVQFGHVQELYLVGYAQVLQRAVDVSAPLWRADTRQLVQGDLELVPAPDKAAGIASRDVVPLQQQYLQAAVCQRGRCCEAAQSRADDDSVVALGHRKVPLTVGLAQLAAQYLADHRLGQVIAELDDTRHAVGCHPLLGRTR